MNINKGILYFQIPRKEKTSIPKVVTGTQTAKPTCVYFVQLISVAHVKSSGGWGAFRTKKEHIHIHSNSKIHCTTFPANCVEDIHVIDSQPFYHSL